MRDDHNVKDESGRVDACLQEYALTLFKLNPNTMLYVYEGRKSAHDLNVREGETAEAEATKGAMYARLRVPTTT